MQQQKQLRLIMVACLILSMFSSLFSQTIDGKQYNYIGNWYNWQGGRFITNLNIPKLQATSGRDTGAIHYKLSDSSIYVWTGYQWRQIGGGGIPTDSSVSINNRILLRFPADTSAGINNRINLRLLKTDTTAKWVTGGFRKAGTDSVFLYVGGLPIFSHKDSVGTGGGGAGGSADSSWITTETGTSIAPLGTLINTLFPGVALPAGWVDNTPTASVVVSGNKVALTLGVMDTTTLSTGTYSGTAYANRVEVDSFYNYNNMRYRFTFVPQTKAATSRLAFSFLPNSLFFSSSTNFYFNLTNTDSAGVVVIRSLGPGSTTYAATQPLVFSVGDSLEVQIIKRGMQMEFIYRNKTTGGVVRAGWSNTTGFGTGGKAYFGVIGGSQDITHFAVDVFDRQGWGIAFLGDSQFAGSGATSEDKTVPNLLFSGNKNRYTNFSNGSATLAQMRNSHVPNIIRLHPEYVIITAGFNDRRDLATDTNTYRQRLDSIVQPLIRAGITVITTTLVPTANIVTGTQANFTTAILNHATTYSLRRIRIDSVLYISSSNVYPRPNMLAADAVHWSDSGMLASANLMRIKLPELDTYFKADTTSFVQLYNVPTGDEDMEVLRVDTRNRLYKFPAKKFDGIINAYNRNGAGTIAQANSQIHTSGPIKSDSAIFANKINFNGSNGYEVFQNWYNFELSNAGTAGTGLNPAYSNFGTGVGNFVGSIKKNNLNKQQGASSFGSSSDNFIWSPINISLSGGAGGNTVLNVISNLGLSTNAQGNILGGSLGGGNIGNGNYNIGFSSLLDYNGGRSTYGASTLTGAIIFGTPWDYNGGEDVANGETVIASYTRSDRIYNFGPKGGFSGAKTVWRPGYQAGTNLSGLPLYIQGMPGTGTGIGGAIIFSTFNAGSSGTAKSTSENIEQTILKDSVKFDSKVKFQWSIIGNKDSLPLATAGTVYQMVGIDTVTGNFHRIVDLNGSATLDFGSTAAATSSDLTITITGAADGDVVSLGVPNAAVSANSAYTAWVSAANTVTVRFHNYQTSGAIDPVSGTFKVRVIK